MEIKLLTSKLMSNVNELTLAIASLHQQNQVFSSRVNKENTKLITSDLNDTVDITLIALTPSSLLMRTKISTPFWGETFNNAKGRPVVLFAHNF